MDTVATDRHRQRDRHGDGLLWRACGPRSVVMEVSPLKSGRLTLWWDSGGGVVGIPMMTSLAKLTQHQAHGTSLIAVASTGLAGALAYWQVGGTEEGVDTLAALILTASATVLAGLGAKASGRVSSPNLKRLMGGFMIAASFSVAIKAYLDYDGPTPSSQPTPTETPDKRCTVLSFTEKASQLSPEHAAIIGAIGAATGFASGFLVLQPQLLSGAGHIVLNARSVPPGHRRRARDGASAHTLHRDASVPGAGNESPGHGTSTPLPIRPSCGGTQRVLTVLLPSRLSHR